MGYPQRYPLVQGKPEAGGERLGKSLFFNDLPNQGRVSRSPTKKPT